MAMPSAYIAILLHMHEGAEKIPHKSLQICMGVSLKICIKIAVAIPGTLERGDEQRRVNSVPEQRNNIRMIEF